MHNYGDKIYLGIDLGTSSVGWAVTDENYCIRRAKGKDLWGVRLFDEAKPSVERRTYRTSRRRGQREKARISMLKGYFEEEINKIDPGFFVRLEESKYHFEDRSENNQQRYESFHTSSASVSKMGKLTVKVEPTPGSESTVISPRFFWTMARTMARPRPLPPEARERDLSTRKKRSKI